jgi:hypothetical protein
MTEMHVERVHTENVVLDIGRDIGALIIYTDETWRGKEIEISPKGSDHRQHNQVHERRFNGRALFAAVYPDVKAGEYTVWQDDSTALGPIRIKGGEVTSIDWRS